MSNIPVQTTLLANINFIWRTTLLANINFVLQIMIDTWLDIFFNKLQYKFHGVPPKRYHQFLNTANFNENNVKQIMHWKYIRWNTNWSYVKKKKHTHTHTRNKPALHTKNTSNGIITRKAARPRWQNLLKNLLCSSPVAYCNIYNTEELADLRHRRKKRKRRRTRKALGFDRFREEQKEKQTVNDTSPDSLPTPCETHNYSRAHTHTRGKKNWEAPR